MSEGAAYPGALAQSDGRWGILVSQSFLDGFALEIGEAMDLGAIKVRITGRLVREPDRLGEPGLFQPEAMIALEAVREAGLLDQGRLFRATYLVNVDTSGGIGRDLDGLDETVKEQFGADAIRLRRPAEAVDGLGALLDLLSSFLAVVGVAALIAGGVPAELPRPARRSGVLPAPLQDYVGGDLDAIQWRPVGMGVKQAILPTSKDAAARLLFIPAGAAMPDHGHGGLEMTMVLQGAFIDSGERFARGDVEVATSDLAHTPIADIGEDCICLAVTDAPLKFKSLLPRIAQPFLRI